MKKRCTIHAIIPIILISFFSTSILPAQEVETLAIIPAHVGPNGGIAVDQEGNVYTAHFGGSTVVKVYPDGTFSTFATGFKTPSGNAFDSNGNFYQSNYQDPNNPNALDTIDKIDTSGVKTTFATGINGPVGIAVDPYNNLFVCGCNANVVYKVTQQSEVTTFTTDPQFNCPNGIIFDDAGNLYMVNWGDGKLFKITPNGTVTFLATIPGGGNGHIGFYENTLYVTARVGNQVYQIDLQGNVELLAGTGAIGSTDGPLLEATFNKPNACTISPDGQYIYTNGRDTRVRKVQINDPVSSTSNTLKHLGLKILNVYPNPTANDINLILVAKKSMKVDLYISDVKGQTVQAKTVQLIAGQNDLSWNIRTEKAPLTHAGMYLLKIMVGEDFIIKKLIIGKSER